MNQILDLFENILYTFAQNKLKCHSYLDGRVSVAY